MSDLRSEAPGTLGRLPEVEPLPPMSIRERVARGLAARDRVPIGSHGTWRPDPTRGDPISVLERQASSRDTALVPLRHGRMAASPFAFYRGGAAIMAADLATTRASGLRAQLCGDAHLVNFGVFDTPERSHVFDINDFDETLAGSWEWDVKRLATSVEVAARDLGFGEPQRTAAVRAAAAGYRTRMAELAEMSNLEVWHARLDVDDVLRRIERGQDHTTSAHLERDVRKGLQRNHLTAFSKLIDTTDGEPHFARHPPRLVPIDDLLDDRSRRRYVKVIREFLHQYRTSLSTQHQHLLDGYRYVHLARKVVGVGSVGTRSMVVLMMGLNDADPLLLQLKEAKRSVLEPYCGPSPYSNHGRRVVEGQRLMQTASDPLLGWYRLRALDDKVHDFYVRQLWDGKASIDLTHLNPKALGAYAEICGATLARAHARTGFRVSIAAYLGDTDEFDDAVAQFARTYADLNEQDHAHLVEAIASGRLAAETEAETPVSDRRRTARGDDRGTRSAPRPSPFGEPFPPRGSGSAERVGDRDGMMGHVTTAAISILDLAIIGPGETAADAFANSVALARRAEARGYRRVWYAEHHSMASIASSATSVLIAHIAAHTARIRLGAGGVMLPNHSPLTIAEQFGTLATLHPGRIDLGLGRAPGSDQATTRALGRDARAADRFPDDVVELQAFLRGESRIPGVQAVPGAGTDVPLYILGSSLFGARLAAMLGLPYAFASHFAPAALVDAIALYRQEFRPSDQLAQPYAIAGVNVIAADTDEEAQDQWVTIGRRRIARFVAPGRELTDDEADAILASPQGRRIAEMMHYSAVGTADRVEAYLAEFAAVAGADELITAHASPTIEQRLRSLDLLADAHPDLSV